MIAFIHAHAVVLSILLAAGLVCARQALWQRHDL